MECPQSVEASQSITTSQPPYIVNQSVNANIALERYAKDQNSEEMINGYLFQNIHLKDG